MKAIKKILESGDSEKIERLSELVDEIITELKEKNPLLYKEIKYELCIMANGAHLSEEMAHDWVSKMRNKDGSVGGHWSIDQVRQFAGANDKNDFYAVMNMLYSDYYNPKFDVGTYVQLATDWLNDKDVGVGKTLRYYLFIVCD